MDERRLNTGHLLAMGILNVPAPQTEVPEDRETVDATSGENWSCISRDAIVGSGSIYTVTRVGPHMEGERDPEVTDEMIDAGVEALVKWFGEEERFTGYDGRAVRDVYVSMCERRLSSGMQSRSELGRTQEAPTADPRPAQGLTGT